MKTINFNQDDYILNRIQDLIEYVKLSKEFSEKDKVIILKKVDELYDIYINSLLK